MLLAKKCQFFSLFTIDKKKRLEIMLGDFAEKKEIFLDLKKTEFFKLQKIPLFQRGYSIPLPKKMQFPS